MCLNITLVLRLWTWYAMPDPWSTCSLQAESHPYPQVLGIEHSESTFSQPAGEGEVHVVEPTGPKVLYLTDSLEAQGSLRNQRVGEKRLPQFRLGVSTWVCVCVKKGPVRCDFPRQKDLVSFTNNTWFKPPTLVSRPVN